ncbi:TolC family protein [Thermophagus sp. OGC60D27]|uniref:TolC family protein n=1 Tax=Thermophagus sp. OGC60D27 TaxID=3458415 RepID=UPI0040377BB0
MRKRIIIYAVGVLLFGSAQAQETISLTLAEAQNYALEHNRTLKNASLEVRKAEASRWQSLATMLPQVSASIEYNNMFDYSMDLGNFQISMPNSVTYGGTASVALSGAQVVGVQLKDISRKMSQITLEQTEQEVADQVKTIYYSALVLEKTASLLEQNLENLQKLFAFTQKSVDVGMSEQTDADKISVQVASMKTSVNTTRRSLEMAYNSLRLQLGLSVDTELKLSQTIDELMSMDNAVSLLQIDFNFDNNYDYQLLQQNVALAKKEVALKKWAYAPSLSAFYQYTKKDYMSDESTMNSTPPNMFGVTLNIPIFSSGSRKKAVQEATFSYEQQLNLFDDTRETLTIQHRQLSYNLKSNYETYETQKKNLEVVQRVFDNVSRKYEQGVASSLDVTNAGSDLISAQSSYVQALLEVVNARIELEQLLNVDDY